MKITEDLKKYLRNSFLDDVLSKVKRPPVEMTSKYVWGKEIKLPFYNGRCYEIKSFELENWRVEVDLSQVDTIYELINLTAEQIVWTENDRLYELDPFDECDSTIICHQLCDWQILADENNNPLRGNVLTLVKYAKFIDMTEYGFKNSVEEVVFANDKGEVIDEGIIESDPIVDTLSFSNPTIEEAYKQGIRDALDWLTDPANKDMYSDGSVERPYYFVYEDEIDNFAKTKGIKCKTK
jgi:hypothetical protein